MTANIQIRGTNKVKARMAKRQKKLSRHEVPYKKAVIVVDGWIQRNFQSEGGLLDQKWPGLAESTQRAKARGRGKKGYRILHGDTGDLKANWKHYFTSRRAIVRSKTPYAIYHDSDQPRKSTLPRRQILPDKKHIQGKITKIFGKFVASNLR